MPQTILNAMTVDVEDYYQVSAFNAVISRDDWDKFEPRVETNTHKVLDLLDIHQSKATFFTLGSVASRFPDLIKRIVADGHELASHGWAHYRVSEQDPASFLDDITKTRKTLEDIGGVRVHGYRAPSFSITTDNQAWAYDALATAGYTYSSSVNPIAHDHYGMPDADRFPYDTPSGIREIPVSTFEALGKRRTCGGGGFFRLFPYAYFRYGIDQVNRKDRHASIFYFHPWEIDPDQPRIADIGAKTRFRHYVNLSRMEGKLKRLLTDYNWGRVDQAFDTGAALPLAAE